ncbi:MAG: peptidase [Deltaproteobacteria bacterium]|nr:MAG: peptidase [Deltaproteobacteria bacterium]
MMRVVFKRELIEGLLEYAKEAHPNEILVLLRGKKKGTEVIIESVVIPPFSIGGEGFASFNPYLLPADMSIVGSVHSHPSGVKRPSTQDLLYGFGPIIVILGYPYRDPIADVAVFDREGNIVPFKLF